jgi:uncharacterized protein (TIGR02147 family)
MNYRSLLQEQFELRRKTNPRYSIRAFAQFLDIDSGTLSAVLKGKRKLPKTHWITSSKKLKLVKTHRKVFLESLLNEHGLKEELDSIISPESELLNSEQYFEIISEWEFAAALCLLDIWQYELSVTGMARDLGLPMKRSTEIYEKLFRYGLIRFENQRIVKTNKNFETTDDVSSKALQAAHLNELELSKDKLQNLNVLEREFTSLTLACRAQDLKKMKTWLREKRNEFERTFEKKDANQIYLFSMQLFPLSQKVEE